MMGDSIFPEGGPLNIRRTGEARHEMSVPLPLMNGMLGRECPESECSPGYFMVKPGTGLSGQRVAYCPYCRNEAEPNAFHTEAQLEYARQMAKNAAIPGINKMLQSALGIGPSGKKTIGGGLISVEMSFTPLIASPVAPPQEEELRRDLTCPHCGLVHAVFGLAFFCPDCGEDLFLDHLASELQTIRRVLANLESRRTALGSRVAMRDVENALEDAVSIFEAVLKVICGRHLKERGCGSEEIAAIIEKRIRNRFQSAALAAECFREIVGEDLFVDVPQESIARLTASFEKRHPITHNLGVVDRKYLQRTNAAYAAGREVPLRAEEVSAAIDTVETVLRSAYSRVVVHAQRNDHAE